MKHVFIIGSKGIPARNGGYETFVENLTKRKVSKEIQYHVACPGEVEKEFEYNRARCFQVKLRKAGSAKSVFYDLDSFRKSLEYIRDNDISDPVICILSCRIGPWIGYYKRRLRKMNGKLYINVDGHEWKRSQWNRWIQAYWKFSEKLMVQHADIVICDSMAIQDYVEKEYQRYRPRKVFVAYGADLEPARFDDEKITAWYGEHQLQAGAYYLVVGRFIPENNFEVTIREFMKSKSRKDLVLITNPANDKFYRRLLQSTGFDRDPRIKFAGTVYDQEMLKKIRKDAFAYIHGHEVGGTNPSLLEAMAWTPLNILLDVSFNREVGEDGAVYFSKENGSLAKLIGEVESYSPERIAELEKRAKRRIRENYSWEKIVSEYEGLFLEDVGMS